MINDNAVDADSGLFNVLRGWTGIIRGADSKTELDDDEDESDLLEADEYKQVTDLLSGKRGWGYSKKIEGQSLKF